MDCQTCLEQHKQDLTKFWEYSLPNLDIFDRAIVLPSKTSPIRNGIMLNTDDPDELLRVIFNYQDHKLVRVLELTNMRVVHKKHMISAAMRMEFDLILRKD